MEYINCFQITSLVLVTMIAIHYFSHKRLNNAENRNFSAGPDALLFL